MSEELGAPLMDPSAVAAHLSVSREVLYDLVQAGQLRAVRWGKRLRFRSEDVQAFIDAGLTEVRAPKISDGLGRLPRAKSPGRRTAAVRRAS